MNPFFLHFSETKQKGEKRTLPNTTEPELLRERERERNEDENKNQ